MAISPDRFREVLARLAGGVAIVTARRPDGTPSGMTATAVCSASLVPPLVLACLDVGTHTHDAVEASGAFAVHLLADGEADLARRFGEDDEDKFRGLLVSTAATGSPLLSCGLGFCDCSVVGTLPAGDHTIFVGRVEAAEYRGSEGRGPLVYFRGVYDTLAGVPRGSRGEGDAAGATDPRPGPTPP